MLFEDTNVKLAIIQELKDLIYREINYRDLGKQVLDDETIELAKNHLKLLLKSLLV